MLFGPIPSGVVNLADRDANLAIAATAPIGDITGDGLPDVNGAGEIIPGGAWSGDLGDEDVVIRFLFTSSTRSGEANGDGQLDVAATDNGYLGVFYGPIAPGDYLASDGDLQWNQLYGVGNVGDGAGSAWFVPDVDGNGRDELAVSLYTNLIRETDDVSKTMLFIYPL